MSQLDLVPGFSAPVDAAQGLFRQLLKAMSEPGSLIDTTLEQPLERLDPATFGVCQTLLDQTCGLWLSPAFEGEAIRRNLGFHTGVRLVGERAEAQFALCHPDDLHDLEGFGRGSAEYPESSCTLILQVERLDNASAAAAAGATTLRLQGPGIESSRYLVVAPLPAVLAAYLQQRPDPFPLGLDLILVAGRKLACVPRSSQVEVI